MYYARKCQISVEFPNNTRLYVKFKVHMLWVLLPWYFDRCKNVLGLPSREKAYEGNKCVRWFEKWKSQVCSRRSCKRRNQNLNHLFKLWWGKKIIKVGLDFTAVIWYHAHYLTSVLCDGVNRLFLLKLIPNTCSLQLCHIMISLNRFQHKLVNSPHTSSTGLYTTVSQLPSSFLATKVVLQSKIIFQ